MFPLLATEPIPPIDISMIPPLLDILEEELITDRRIQ
jgi:hypothetical protein